MLDVLKIDAEVEEILEKALAEKRIDEGEAVRLMHAKGDDLIAISIVANKLRERRVSDVVTYVVNRNINFTNVCIGSCRFCAFKRNKTKEDAYLLSIEEILEKVREAKALGATEVCLQGGLHPDLSADFYFDVLEAIKGEVDIHIHAFSPMEVKYAADKSGSSIKDVLKTLKDKGLDSMPGTAAEILYDRVRQKICSEKLSTREWVECIKEAHRLGIPTTGTMMYGHVENVEEQVTHLKILRDIQDETRGFTEFVPLSFVHFNSQLYLTGDSKGGATGMEDLRVYAVSRIFLDNFDNIQSSWVKLGRKLSQVILGCGANDLGGTLIEENISRAAGLNSEMIDEAELRRMIVEAGRIPKKRDTLYRIIEGH